MPLRVFYLRVPTQSTIPGHADFYIFLSSNLSYNYIQVKIDLHLFVFDRSHTMPTKQTHQYLRRELAKIKDSFLHALIENAQYGFSLITTDFLVLEANDKMLEWFPEVKAGDGSLCYKCFYSPESETPCPGCPAELSRQDGKVHSAVIEKCSSANHPQYFKITCTPVMDKNSSCIGVIEIAENITEKVGLEHKIHALESQYYQLIDTANDAIIACNTDGNIILFNKKAQELFGYGAGRDHREEVLFIDTGRDPEEQQTRFQQLLAETESAVPNKIFAGVCLKKDGTTFLSEITYSVQSTEQGVTITAIIRDITERRAAEARPAAVCAPAWNRR